MYMAFLFAPTEAFMGDVQRIMYIHVASAQSAYLALLIALVASVLVLRRGGARWDALALAAVEVAVMFTTITLISGSFWARAVWGWWWTWDPRLTSTLVMWFVYMAYLVLRRALDDPERRARIAAVVAILGFINVPLVHMSVTWWVSIHPGSIRTGETQLHPDMLIALVIASLAMLATSVLLTWLRFRTEAAERAVAALRALQLEARR